MQSSLLKRIKEGIYKEMSEEDLSCRFPLIPSTNPTLPLSAKRLKDAEPEHESISQLRRMVRESAPVGRIGVPAKLRGS